MIWQYGNYKFDCELQPPTLNKFEIWKDEFFKLDNVNKYDVWLTGGFIEEWNTKDIDIVLNNKPVYNELQTIMSEAIKIGIDNNIFVDICHLNMKPLDYTSTKKSAEVIKTVVGNKIIQDGKMITDWTNSTEIYPNLYQFKKSYPTDKQIKRTYKTKPILLNR